MENLLENIDELNVIVQTSYYTASKKEEIIDDILSILVLAYLAGIEEAKKFTNFEIAVSADEMDEVIFFMINGETFEDRAVKHIEKGDVNRLQMLVDSEYHRVFNTAVDNGVNQYLKNHPTVGTKTWHTMLDDRVRDTHTYLEGITIPIDSEFYTYDGDHAPFPSMFQNANNNINCRCYLTYQFT